MFAAALIIAAQLALSGPQAHAIVFLPQTKVSDRIVRLGAIADLASVPRSLKDAAAHLEIVRLGSNQDRIDLYVEDLDRRVFALMPDLESWLPVAGKASIEVRFIRPTSAAASSASEKLGCLRVLAPSVRGAFPKDTDFAAAPCAKVVDHALAYDPHVGVVRAVHDLGLGDIVSGVDRSTLSRLSPGQPVYLETMVGPVKIQRLVRAIQPEKPGRGFFAIAQDGTVVAAPALGDVQ